MVFEPLSRQLEEAGSFIQKFPAMVPHAVELRKLAEDLRKPPFVVVMGAFKAGKSTFLNALLGQSLLAVDVLPATAAVTVLRHGHSQTFELHGHNRLPVSLPISRLRELSSEGTAEAAGMREGLSHIEVSLDRAILQMVTLVDTPGLNSTIESHTQATQAFIERADAVIWVLSYRQPLNDDEKNRIESLPQGLGLLVLVNHVDDRDPEEDTLIEVVDRVQNNLHRDHLSVVPLSARLALDGFVRRDPDLLAAANWTQFLKAFDAEILTNSLPRRLSRLQVKLQKELDSINADLQSSLTAVERTYSEALGGTDYQAKIKDEHRVLQGTLAWLRQNRSATDKVAELDSVPDSIPEQKKFNRQLSILKASHRSLLKQGQNIGNVKEELDGRREELNASLRQLSSDVKEYNHSGLFGGAPIFFDGPKNALDARDRALAAQLHDYNVDLELARTEHDRLVGRFERFEDDCQEFLDKIILAIEAVCGELLRTSHDVRRGQQEAAHRLAEMSWLKRFAVGASKAQCWQLAEAFLLCATEVHEQPAPDIRIDVASLKAQLNALTLQPWHVEAASAIEPAPPVSPKPIKTANRNSVYGSRFALALMIVAVVLWVAVANSARISTWAGRTMSGTQAALRKPLDPAPVTVDAHPAGTRFVAGDWDAGRALSFADQARTRVTLDAPFRENGRDRRIVTAAEWGGCDACKAKTAIFYFSKYQDGWTLDASNAAFIGEGDFLNSPTSELVMLGPARHGIRLTTDRTIKGEGYSEMLLGGWSGSNFETLWDGFIKERECSTDGACTSKESVVDLVPGANPEYYDVLVSPVGEWAAKSLFTITGHHDAYMCASGACANVPDVPHEQLDSVVAKVINAWISTAKDRDLKGHMALYGDPVDTFYMRHSVSRTDVTKEIAGRMELYSGFPTLEVSDLSWQQVVPGRLLVDFDKHYLGNTKTGIAEEGKVRSQLTLRRIGSNWQIVGERDSKIYWKRTDDSEKRRIEAARIAATEKVEVDRRQRAALEAAANQADQRRRVEAEQRAATERLVSDGRQRAAANQADQRRRAEAEQKAANEKVEADRRQRAAAAAASYPNRPPRVVQPPELQPRDGGQSVRARPPQLQQTQAEESFWRTVQSRGNPYSFEAYLKVYPLGAHSAEAQQKMQKVREADVREAQKRRERGELFIPQLGIAVRKLSPEQVQRLQRKLVTAGQGRGWNQGWIGALEVTAVNRDRLPYGFEVRHGDIILSFGQKRQLAYVDPNGLTAAQDLADRVASLGFPRDRGGPSVGYTFARNGRTLMGIVVWDSRVWALHR